MARRKIIEPDQRVQPNSFPVAAPDAPEAEHFYTCSSCGQRVDCRQLGDVLHHEAEGHRRVAEAEKTWAPKFIEPMLATLEESPPPGDGWSHEIKFDGYRTQLHIRDGEGRSFSRDGQDWSDRYQLLIDAALNLPCESAVIDGEVICRGEFGKCDFAGLRAAIEHEPHRLVMMAFDLIELDGQDLRRKPLKRRRELLAKLLGPGAADCPIQFSADVLGDGMGLFMVVDDLGLEGIISKRVCSPYSSGRSPNWVKVKCFTDEDLIVIGTEAIGTGSLALLAREVDGGLEYVGSAMVKLRRPERDQFWRAAEALAIPAAPLPMPKRKASWVSPQIYVRVRTLRGEEKLRHATIRALLRITAQ